jgi:gliding motility-associated-like protein
MIVTIVYLHFMPRLLRENWKVAFLAALMLVVGFTSTKASHLFGGEFYYVHTGGTNYKFTLNLYVDCSTPNQQLLTNLYSSNPQVVQYNGTTFVDSFVLNFVNDADVTPTCPSVVSTCASPNGTQQGVRRYTYEITRSIPTTSTNWRFVMNGSLNFNNNLTGRSGALTNVSVPGNGGSVMMLEATLNNTGGANSNASYTTIPTPFFCINQPSAYNQGAVDPDGDALDFALVPGLQAPNTTVTYIVPFSATAPLATAAGAFSFSTTTGQLNFTPNQIQNSVVVTKVTETRNGVVVGSSMREMVFVVLNNCNNTPPGGGITNTNVGVIDSSVNIYICQSAPSLVFTIPPTDLNGDTINVSYVGLPGNATLSIAGNGTTSPVITGTWTPIGGFVIGDYTFYVTYEDNGCPLKASQTIAYTIHVLPAPVITAAVTHASCTNGLVGSITASVTNGNPAYTYNIGGAGQASNAFNNVVAGNYTVAMVDAKNCTASTVVTITQPPLPVINSVTKTTATCSPGCDATMSITATLAGATLEYSVDAGVNYQSSSNFANLCVGSYTIVVKDANTGCATSSAVNITLPPQPTITSLTATTASCNPGCDATISGISVSPANTYTFTLNGGGSNTAGLFNNVCVGTYTIVAADAALCTASSVVTIVTPPGPIFGAVNTTTASCIPGCDGSISSFACTSVNGGLSYQLNGGTSQITTTFNGLCVGTYTILATDASGCTATTTVNITVQPNPTITSINTTQASCVPGCDASATVAASAAGGLSITYQQNTNGFVNSNVFNSLCVGTYTFTVKDSKGCTATSTAVVSKVPDPTISALTKKDISCNGANDGQINITVSGNGTVTYTLLPGNNVNTTGAYSNLTPNTYTINAVDSKGCTLSTNITVIEPDVLTIIQVNKQDKTCVDKDNGSIEVLITGGTGPFNFELQPKNITQQSNFFGSLADGTYTVTVRDVNGCSTQTTVVLLPPFNPLVIEMDGKSVACTGFGTDGYALVTASAGNPPYTYIWNTTPPRFTPRIDNLFGGTFVVAVTDSLGCTEIDSVILVDPTYCCEEIYVPNAFTPNYDGANDNITPLTTTNITNYKFLIFDRWGNNVFSSTTFGQRWDGTYQGREGSDLGVYFYVMSYTCLINNREYIKKGDILLLK